ncbi:MAG: hypothetical protein AB8V19_02770 [Candidatus Midichloria sp.]|uniref:Uncharacterized protein n=1 Tax=Hyalomma marginatum TaxID=34627 RepID=A0A8S4C1H0_9ACAR|nr:hypothetical protein MHYMCMPASI_00156 [Hyalomma marginatum]CAG7593008.1 hypothetical protein MHYMCMPSP_00767 [Hyalomma marginatum]
MIPLSVKFFADTISSIQQVAGIASLVALTHNAVKSGSVINAIYADE